MNEITSVAIWLNDPKSISIVREDSSCRIYDTCGERQQQMIQLLLKLNYKPEYDTGVNAYFFNLGVDR